MRNKGNAKEHPRPGVGRTVEPGQRRVYSVRLISKPALFVELVQCMPSSCDEQVKGPKVMLAP